MTSGHSVPDDHLSASGQRAARRERVWFSRGLSSTYHVLRLIREADESHRICLICSHGNPCFTGFQVADEHFREPHGLSGEPYRDWCLSRCREHPVDLLVPGRSRKVFAESAEEFRALGVEVWLAGPPETVDFCHDKARFYADLPSTIGSVPVTIPVNTAAEYHAAIKSLASCHPRLCVKPSRAVFGIGFRLLDNTLTPLRTLLEDTQYRIHPDDLARILASVERLPDLLVMEYLDGAEWSVDCAALHGCLIAAVARKKLKLPGNVQQFDQREEFLEIARKLTAYFRLNGLFNFQLREGGGRVALLEVNTRVSGGIGLACASGVNLPWLALQSTLDGRVPTEIPPARNGLRVAEAYYPVVVGGSNGS